MLRAAASPPSDTVVRGVLGATALAITGLALFSATAGAEAYGRFWSNLIALPQYPPFADLRTIFHGIDCLERGIDPMLRNPCDPWGRIMNYPSIWLSLRHLGLASPHVEAFGFGVALVLAASCTALFWRIRRSAVLWMPLLCLSPAVLFAVERGNNDIIVFGLVVAALALQERARIGAAGALLAVAAVLKLFPVFAALPLLRPQPQRAVVGLIASLAALALYAFWMREELRYLASAIPQLEHLSYGYPVLGRQLTWFVPGLDAARGAALAGWAALAVAVAALAIGLRGPPLELPEGFEWNAFLAGAGVYTSTFLVGAHFNYRLIFLLLAAPQLLSWYRDGVAPAHGASRWMLWILLFALFTGSFLIEIHGWVGNVVNLANALATWVLFAYFALWIARFLRASATAILAVLRQRASA